MSPIQLAFYFSATVIHITGIFAGWYYHKSYTKRKMPGRLAGKAKMLFPPDDAPECMKEAFWAGCTSDYIDTYYAHKYWKNACIAYKKG
jgi:hypothetical protein